MHWDLSSVFKKLPTNRLLFNGSATITLGGRVSYMNTDAPTHQHPDSGGTEVMAEFLNTETQVVHKHHVGNVYSSYAEMMDVRAGFLWRIGQ